MRSALRQARPSRPPPAPVDRLPGSQGERHAQDRARRQPRRAGRASRRRRADLVYIDPPFNTGKPQKRDVHAHRPRRRTATAPASAGSATDASTSAQLAYGDAFDDYLGFLEPRLREAARAAHRRTARFFFHLDYREVALLQGAARRLFGRASFMNEIIWAYDYGGRPKNRWPAKHDTILWYARRPRAATSSTTTRSTASRTWRRGSSGRRRPRAARRPTDMWWHTIVSPTGKEKPGYPTQKPLGILERIVRVALRPGDVVLDFFAGSGTTGEAAARNGRGFVLVDSNPEAVQVMAAASRSTPRSSSASRPHRDRDRPARPSGGRRRGTAPAGSPVCSRGRAGRR